MSESNQLTVTPTAGAVVRDAGVELEVRADVNAAAMGAREEAAVKARVMLARANPRDWDLVRTRVLKDCKRPGFARSAVYKVPRAGKFIEGLSIRFAEDIARIAGNLWVASMVVSETRETRVVDVFAMDLETNFTESQQAIMNRTVERRANKDGSPPVDPSMVVGERRNSYGDKVFICIATDEEMLTKQNALVSRIRRNKILEMVPADILEEAKALALKVAATEDAKDPDAAKKAVIDGFASINVTADALKSFVQAKYGTTIDLLRPESLTELRGIFTAIRDGMATWESFVGAVAPGQTTAPKTGEVVTAPQLPAQTRIEPKLERVVDPIEVAEEVLRLAAAQEPQKAAPAEPAVPRDAMVTERLPEPTPAKVVDFPAPKTAEQLIAEIRAARVDPKDKQARLKKVQSQITKLADAAEKARVTRIYLAAVAGSPDPEQK